MNTTAYIYPATIHGKTVIAWKIATKDTRIANRMSLKAAKHFVAAQGWTPKIVARPYRGAGAEQIL